MLLFLGVEVDRWRRKEEKLIGRHNKISSVEATLIHVDNKGTVVYGEEVKLESIQGCPLELPEEVERLLGIRRLTGWLLYTNRKEYRNHHLVATEIPARNLYFIGELKPSSHRKKSDIVKALQSALKGNYLGDPIRAISQALSSLSFQPFESCPALVSAWLIEPTRIEELSITQHTRRSKIKFDETIKSSLRGNFALGKAKWSLGICKDLDSCIGLLETDEEKDRLFKQTENVDLFKNYRYSRDSYCFSMLWPVYRQLTTIAVDLREYVFRLAIMTALAGIDESLYPLVPKDSSRPVMTQVKLRYHQLMYALVKRCHLSDPVLGTSKIPSADKTLPEELEELEEMGEEARPPSGAVPSYNPFKTLREELEEMRERIRPLGQDIFMQRLEKTVAETDAPDETLARLILAVPREWDLSAKLVSWLRCCQSQFSEVVQTMLESLLGSQ